LLHELYTYSGIRTVSWRALVARRRRRRIANSSWQHFAAASRSLWTGCAATHSEDAASPTTRPFRRCSWLWRRCTRSCSTTSTSRRTSEVPLRHSSILTIIAQTYLGQRGNLVTWPLTLSWKLAHQLVTP